MVARYEYEAEKPWEGFMGGTMPGGGLEEVLDDDATKGRRLEAVTSVEVTGRTGPGGVDGVLVTFRRPVV